MAKTIELLTPQQVYDFYCDVNTYAHKQVAEIPDVEFRISKILPIFSQEEIKEVVIHSPETPLTILFSESFFNAKLETIKAKEEMKKMKTLDRATANNLDLLTKAVAKTVEESVEDLIFDDIEAKIKERFGPQYREVKWKSVDGKEIGGVVHEKFEDISEWISIGENIMLTGPAGTGKNFLARQLAEAFGLDYFQSNAIQQPYDLTGFVDANGNYNETAFYKFCKADKALFLLDEFDDCNPEALVTFNDAMSSFVMNFPNGEVVNFKENHIFVCCANTFGTGATLEYCGRNQLDAATLNRFGVVEVGYSTVIEEALCPNTELLEFIRDFRNACVEHGIKHVVSYRDINRLYKKITNYPKSSLEDTLKQGLTRNLEPNDLSTIADYLGDNKYAKAIRKLSRR